jgi:hypothetical protein
LSPPPLQSYFRRTKLYNRRQVPNQRRVQEGHRPEFVRRSYPPLLSPSTSMLSDFRSCLCRLYARTKLAVILFTRGEHASSIFFFDRIGALTTGTVYRPSYQGRPRIVSHPRLDDASRSWCVPVAFIFLPFLRLQLNRFDPFVRFHSIPVRTGQQEQFKAAYGETAGEVMKRGVEWAMRTPEQGAMSVLWASVSEEARLPKYPQGTCKSRSSSRLCVLNWNDG